MSTAVIATIALLIAQAGTKAAAARPATACDLVTFKDGATVRGQIVNLNDRGKLVFVVRRAWASEHLPERAAEWRGAEAPWMRRARAERLGRLQDWRRQRPPAENDTLGRSLDAEIERLRAVGDDDDLPPLMMVAVDRRQVSKTERRPDSLARLQRLAWRSNLPDPESLSLEDLKGALEARNVLTTGDAPVAIDDLLPLPLESEPQWRLKRAATEVQNDKALWFALHEGALIPEGAGAQPMSLMGLLPDALRSLTSDGPPPDPVPAKLKSLAAAGAAGAVITRLNFLPEFAGVQVDSALWVRVGDGPDDWRIGLKASSVVRSEDARGAAQEAVKNDPQVQGLFNTIEGLGLGEIPADLKQRALAIGAATQQGTTRAKGSLNEQLSPFVLNFDGTR